MELECSTVVNAMASSTIPFGSVSASCTIGAVLSGLSTRCSPTTRYSLLQYSLLQLFESRFVAVIIFVSLSVC